MFSAEKFAKVELFGSVINDDIYVMKMTKKATKRLIRKRIAQRKAKDATKHTTKPNNSIRGQLMNIAAQNMANGIRPFGYASQQYGNINNERRIEQLRNDAQTKTNNIQNDNVIIQSFQKQIDELSADSERMKKMIKDKQSELDKTKHEKGMIEDKLTDAENVERENDRLKEQTRMRERRLAEVSKDNHIIELKQERERLHNEIQKQDLQLIEKQKQLESNIIYNENRKLKDDLDAIIAKHAYYDDILKSDEFKNPHKEHYEMLKQLALEKERLQQQKELYDITMESKQIADTLKSQPTKEEYEAVAKEYAAKIQAENQNLMNIKKQQTDLQDEVDMVNYQHEQYMKARKEVEENLHKLDMLRKENTYLNGQLAKDGNNKRYAEQLTKAANIRAKGLRKAIVVSMKQDLLKQKLENDTLEKVGEIINEQPTEEEQRLAKIIGESKANNEALKEQQRLKNELHASSLRLAEEQATKDFHNSQEYKTYLDDNKNLKMATQNNLNNAAEMKAANEAVRRLDESRIAFEVQRDTTNIGSSDVQQVIHLSDAATNTFKKMKEKSRLTDILNQKISSFKGLWDWFVSLHTEVLELLEQDDSDISVEALQDLIGNFTAFVRNPPQQMPQPSFSPQSGVFFNTPRRQQGNNELNDDELEV